MNKETELDLSKLVLKNEPNFVLEKNANYLFANSDFASFLDALPDACVDLIITDPPFALNETSFNKKHYASRHAVTAGYKEAPDDISYEEFAYSFIKHFNRILKPNGSVLLISGWTNEADVQYAFRKDEHWRLVNHLIWNFNFGVYTTSKYVTSHYDILWYCKKTNKTPYFNRNAYFKDSDRLENNRSAVYKDTQDVIKINREYKPNQERNSNELPSLLCEKLIKHHSKIGGVVLDCFAGSFAISKASLRLKRKTIACEINRLAYKKAMNEINNNLGGCVSIYEKDTDLIGYEGFQDESKLNAGKKLTLAEKEAIRNFYNALEKNNLKLTKKEKIEQTAKQFKRGVWGIKRIIEEKF